jgi:hypothetical protein
LNIHISIGSVYYARATPSNKTIHFNSNFAAGPLTLDDPEDPRHRPCRCQILFLVIKLLHEVAHLLTGEFNRIRSWFKRA